MQDKPDLRDDVIAACLDQSYGVKSARIEFLPLGYDSNAWVYRVDAAEGPPYFLKLKRHTADEGTLAIPHVLRVRGIEQVVAPLPTKTGVLWTSVDRFAAILYPFVEGKSGRDVGLSPEQWLEFGAVLKAVHAAELPPEIARRLPHEEFILTPRFAAVVRDILAGTYERFPQDDLARELTAFLRGRRDEIAGILRRAEELGRLLQNRRWDFVLCHADVHVANVLIDRTGRPLIVDWDQPIFAPKERDLMFVLGTALRGFVAGSTEEEAFFRGYGRVEIDRAAVAYYRYEWAVEDIGGFAEQVYVLSDLGENSKRRAGDGLRGTFQPGGIVDAAYQSEADLMEPHQNA